MCGIYRSIVKINNFPIISEFLETGKLQFSQIRVAGDEDDENLLDKIPSPSPFFTERSDDLRTQKEDDDDGNVSDDKDSG